MNTWELKEVKETEWKQDDSGMYTVIHRVVSPTIVHKGLSGEPTIEVRIDVMSTQDIPLISFQGKAEAVRKHVVRWIENRTLFTLHAIFSAEHASYIGAELVRAELTENYIQS